MKAVIFAGGLPSTISKEQERIPKPMVEIGGKPLIWHIMKSLSEQGISEFIICGGYKVELIKEYLLDFYIYQSDITIDLSSNTVVKHKNRTENWTVTVLDTGVNTSLFKRLEKVKKYVDGDFYVTYGDCLSDIDIAAMRDSHEKSGKMATMSLVKPTGRKELLHFGKDGELVKANVDESFDDGAWINGDSFIFSSDVFNKLIEFPGDINGFMNSLVSTSNLNAYKHKGYWTSIETMNDLVNAENLWNQGKAPWVKA